MTSALRSVSIEALLDSLGAKQPVPGGGAAAGITASLGIAAARMVLAYSVGRTELSEHEASNVEAMSQLDSWKDASLALAEADAQAFERLSTLWKLPEDDPARTSEWDAAVRGAIEPPLSMCNLCLRACTLLQTLPERTNPLLASDLAVSAVLLNAACAAAAWNVRVNLPNLPDEEARKTYAEATTHAVSQCRELAMSIEQAC